MPNIKSAEKRMRQNEKRRLRNRIYRGGARTQIKNANKTLESPEADLATAQEQTLLAIKSLDRAASKGVLHKNNAARRKSRLMKRLAKFQVKPSKKK